MIMQTKRKRLAEIRRAEIAAEYHEFMDIFKPKNVEKLLDYGLQDLKINLKPETTIPSKSHFSASLEEREILNKYLEENLLKYFIRPSSSPAGTPVLFVRK